MCVCAPVGKVSLLPGCDAEYLVVYRPPIAIIDLEGSRENECGHSNCWNIDRMRAGIGFDGVCKTCGGSDLRDVSETVTEVLAYVPARFEVVRHVRPACSCRKCETMAQAAMPELPIPRGMVDASFLAHMIVAKFCDHIPLYRQAEIDRRAGVAIDRSQRAAWLGHVACDEPPPVWGSLESK